MFVEGLYEGLKEDPSIWLSAALKFKRVANLVLMEVEKDEEKKNTSGRPRIDDTYVFLMSVAIENILKGLLVANGESYSKITADHKIAKLYDDYSKKFGFKVTKDERRILGVLTHAATWAGRFNLPRKPADLAEAFERHGLTIASSDYGLSIFPLLSNRSQAEPGELKEVREKIDALYERLYTHFKQSLK